MREITLDDFLNINAEIPEVRSNAQEKLLRFFTKYEPGCVYKVIGDDLALRNAMENEFDFFKSYGIVAGLSNTTMIIPEADSLKVVWYVDGAVDVQDQFEKFVTKYNRVPSCCVIYNNEDVKGVARKVREIAHACSIVINVWNVNAVDDSVTSHRRDPRFEYEDLTDIIRSKFSLRQDMNVSFKNILEIADYVRAKADKKIIYYVTPGVEREISDCFNIIAAMLTFEGYNFELSSDNVEPYIRNLRSALHRECMLLGDYLQKIVNPVPVALKVMQDRSAFVCVSMLPQNARYKLQLDIMEIPLDDDLCIRCKDVLRVQCSYWDIEVLDVVQLFDLKGSYDEQIPKMFALDKLIAEFEEIVNDSYTLPEFGALNCTNVLFYKRDGKMRIGYIPAIKASYQYALYPLMKGYPGFPKSMSLAEYDDLIDIGVLADSADVLNLLTKSGLQLTKGIHFKKPRFLNGMVVMSRNVTTQTISEQSGLTMVETGIWGIQARQCRSGSEAELLSYFNKRQLRNKHFLTFWGGCNPAIMTSLVASSEVWR